MFLAEISWRTALMKAMVLKRLGRITEDSKPLEFADLPVPVPAAGELLVEVAACGVCHTELDEIEGRTPPPRLPVVPGHQVVGRVAAAGSEVDVSRMGDRVGVAWIHSTCGRCRYCLAGDENLCPDFKATGRDVDGGYAQYLTVPAAFAYPIPEVFTDIEAAPLLCAGAIGYRSLRLAGFREGGNLGLTGFGASGHLVLQLARHRYPGSRVFVFARSEAQRKFAEELGASWTGDTGDEPPMGLDCIIDTTPAWRPVVAALKNLTPGGRLVINAIGKEEADKEVLLGLNYPAHLWLEKEVKSVANVSRRDVAEFLALAAEMRLRPEVREFGLKEANQALLERKTKRVRGAKVLRIA